jgi:hypothetical protein
MRRSHQWGFKLRGWTGQQFVEWWLDLLQYDGGRYDQYDGGDPWITE